MKEETNQFNKLAASKNFKGNLWRLSALFLLKKGTMTDRLFKTFKYKIKNAEANYTADGNFWGLGLTYNLMGRAYSSKDHYSFVKSKEYFLKAIENFNKCDHYRGLYFSSKDIHDLQT